LSSGITGTEKSTIPPVTLSRSLGFWKVFPVERYVENCKQKANDKVKFTIQVNAVHSQKEKKRKKPDKEKRVTFAFNRFTRDVVRMII